jgi:hypothetical protein
MSEFWADGRQIGSCTNGELGPSIEFRNSLEHVLKYLARYTHRVAISNGRLLSLDNGQVRFHWQIPDITTAAAS